MIRNLLRAVAARLSSCWEALGHDSLSDIFTGHGRVLHKERVWDEDDELDNVAYLFVVFDEDHQQRLTFRASPAFADSAKARVGDRIKYEYLLWDSILPVSLTIATGDTAGGDRQQGGETANPAAA